MVTFLKLNNLGFIERHINAPFENPLIRTPKVYGPDEVHKYVTADVVVAQNASAPGEMGEICFLTIRFL